VKATGADGRGARAPHNDKALTPDTTPGPPLSGGAGTVNDAKTGKQLRLFVGLVAFVGLCCVGWALVEVDPIPLRQILFVAAVAVITAAANGPIVQLRVRSEIRTYSSTSGAVLLAVAVLPAPWAVLSTAAGALTTKLLLRQTPRKAVFNIAKIVQAATAATAVAWAAGLRPVYGLQLHLPSVPRLIVALTLAAIVYAIVDDLLLHTVMAVSTGTPWLQAAGLNWDVGATGRLANLAVALLTALVVRYDRALVIAMPPTILALQFAAKNRIRRRTDQDAWRRLAATTDDLNVTDLVTVLRAAVTRAPGLFSAEEAEVELRGGDTVRLVRGCAEGVLHDGPPEAAAPRHEPVIEAVLEGHDDVAVLGVLRLRFRKLVKLDDSEQYKLLTFASALTTAIRNAEAYAELTRIAAENAYAAAHDPLTGLANRRELLERAGDIFDSRSGGGMAALLVIDLNHFKEVNDTLGHNSGDLVLCEVARRLEAASRPEDLVARLGGDEFAVLLTGLPTPAMAAHRAQALLASLDPSIEVDGMQLTIEASGGIALASGAGGVTELLRRADVAMYQAKRSGRRTANYLHTLDTADVGRLILGNELSRAVAEHEFTVDFLPIVDLASGEVVSAEALARWHHPQHGDLSPMQFLETVERSGRLPAFADAVLEQSLTALSRWREAGFDLAVAVNVSPRSLLDPHFPAAVLSRLAAHAVPAGRLVLELAETLTISQLEVVGMALSELRGAGVRLALDDFGTGFSSLSVLSRIPVHLLKVDRDFVAAVETSPEAAAVIRSAVDLARSLHLTVVADGVESEPQRRTLWELGCVAGQGHLFARPMGAERLLATLQRGAGGRPGVLASALHDGGSVVRLPRRRPNGRGRTSLPHLPA
jgi:diguanylate cyclase